MMNRYKTGLFGFQGEFFKIKDLFDFLALGEARGDLIDTVYLDPPTEISVYGNIYHASKYRDYAMSDDIHYLILEGNALGAQSDSEKTFINLVVDDSPIEGFQDESPYAKAKEIINSGNTEIALESLSFDARQINMHLVFLLIAELTRRAEILMTLSEMLKEKRFGEILEKVAEEAQVKIDDLGEYLLKSIDVQAVERNPEPLLETAEYMIQSPFLHIIGIYNKKTGEVRLLTPEAISFNWDNWGDRLGRDLWSRAGDAEFIKEATALASVELLSRSILNLKLSLYNMGFNVDGTKAFFLKRFFEKRALRKILRYPD